MSSDEFQQVKTNDIQKQITNMLAELISSKISLKKIAIKGFLWKAMREWQVSHNSTVMDTEDENSSSTSIRIAQITEMLNIFKSKISEVLSENERINLDEAIKECIKQYSKKYAHR